MMQSCSVSRLTLIGEGLLSNRGRCEKSMIAPSFLVTDRVELTYQ